MGEHERVKRSGSVAGAWRTVGHVVELLSNVEGTGDPEADEHVEAAREIARALLDG